MCAFLKRKVLAIREGLRRQPPLNPSEVPACLVPIATCHSETCLESHLISHTIFPDSVRSPRLSPAPSAAWPSFPLLPFPVWEFHVILPLQLGDLQPPSSLCSFPGPALSLGGWGALGAP